MTLAVCERKSGFGKVWNVKPVYNFNVRIGHHRSDVFQK